MLSIGQKAPAFTLFNTEKQPVSLSSFSGQNLVILFFPLAFTSVCTAQLCRARDNMNMYTKLNAKVVGISVDSPFALERFREEQGLSFDLLSDFNKGVSKAYDCLYDTFVLGMEGVSKRAAFVVDGERIIRHAEVLENAGMMPDFKALDDALKAI